MKAELINPFLESARMVIEQVVNIRPSTGKLGMKQVVTLDDYIWIQIGMTGQMKGDIFFGFAEHVALKMVSAMMGGFVLTEMNEISRSAISELGNMISGNASTMLYNQGVKVDITPPRVWHSLEEMIVNSQALTIPLQVEGIGQMDLQVLVS